MQTKFSEMAFCDVKNNKISLSKLPAVSCFKYQFNMSIILIGTLTNNFARECSGAVNFFLCMECIKERLICALPYQIM